MRLILLFIVFVLMTSLVSVISGKKFGRAVPVAVISSTLFVYYTGFIFDTFKVGYLLMIAAAVAGLVLVCIQLKKDSSRVRELIVTNGFYCFIAVFLVVSIMDYHRAFRNWDEFSHWGVMVKEMLRLDGFYIQDASRLLVHKDYPPFGSLFEMLWCYFAGGYSEAVSYKALHFMILSLILPFAADCALCGRVSVFKVKKEMKTLYKKILSAAASLFMAILAAIGLVAVISSLDTISGFDTIYQDIPMAIILVYGLAVIMTSEKMGDWFDVIALSLASIALVLTKQIGITFDLIIWFYYALRAVFDESKPIKKRILMPCLGVLIMALTSIVSEKIWKMKVASFGITGQFSIQGIDMDKVREIFTDSYGIVPMREVLNKYIHALLERNLTSLPVNITYFSALFIVPLLIFLVYRLSEGIIKKRDAIILGLSLFVGAVGYALAMGFTFLFMFDYSEIKDLAYYERYLGTYFMAQMLVVLLFMFYAAFSRSGGNRLRKCFMAVAAFAVFANGYNLSTIVPDSYNPVPQIEARRIAELIENNSDGQVGTFIVSEDTIESQYYVNYYCEDAAVILSYAGVLNADYSDATTKKDIIGMVLQGELLYVKDLSDGFAQAMQDVCKASDLEQIYAEHLYRVIHEGDTNVRLEMIAGL